MIRIVPLVFALFTVCAAAHTQIVLPEGSTLDYRSKANQQDYFYFEGEASATGLVVAYWEARYLESGPTSLDKAEPIKEMYLRFYPDSQTQSQLPSFRKPSGEVAPLSRIFLYRDHKAEEPLDILTSAYTERDTVQIRDIVAQFTEVPEGFLAYQEGAIVQPATVALSGLLSFVEGNHRFLYAKLGSMEPLSTTDYGLRQIAAQETDNFLGMPWVERFYAPDPLQVRQHPEDHSPITAELPAATSIEKLKTIDQEWVRVRAEDSGARVVEGYVRKSDLKVIN